MLAVTAIGASGCTFQFNVEDAQGRALHGLPVMAPNEDGTERLVYVNMRRTPFGKDQVVIEIDAQGRITKLDAGTESSESPFGNTSDLVGVLLPIAVGAAAAN